MTFLWFSSFLVCAQNMVDLGKKVVPRAAGPHELSRCGRQELCSCSQVLRWDNHCCQQTFSDLFYCLFCYSTTRPTSLGFSPETNAVELYCRNSFSRKWASQRVFIVHIAHALCSWQRIFPIFCQFQKHRSREPRGSEPISWQSAGRNGHPSLSHRERGGIAGHNINPQESWSLVSQVELVHTEPVKLFMYVIGFN